MFPTMTRPTNLNVRVLLLDPSSYHTLELAPGLVLATATACSAMGLTMSRRFGSQSVPAAHVHVARRSHTEIVSSRG